MFSNLNDFFIITWLFQNFAEPLVNAVSFKFIFKDGEHEIDQWEGAQIDKSLFIEVPNDKLPVGIKEGWVLVNELLYI